MSVQVPAHIRERILARNPSADVSRLNANYARAQTGMSRVEKFDSIESMYRTRAMETKKTSNSETYSVEKNEAVLVEIRRRLANGSLKLENGKFVQVEECKCGVRQIDNRIKKMVGLKEPKTTTM